MFIFVIMGLLVTAGSSSVVFVQRGKDLPLDVMTADVLEDDVAVFWNFNKTNLLVRFFPGREPSVSPAYKGKLEFPEKKYSLKLKDLQEADTGLYTAQATGTDDTKIIAEYHVTVQGPVSPVNLAVDSVSKSSDSCNITVTCRAQGSHISSTFRCDATNCSQEGGERSEVTASGAFLHIYLAIGSIICNHSNKVSRTKDMKTTQDICSRHDGSSSVVFVQRGKDLPLDVRTADVLEDYVLVFWNFNITNHLVRFLRGREPIPSPAYEGRLEFPEKKYSLKLKDLQEADTGLYTAQATGTREIKLIAEYHVTVQGPVSPVNLAVDSLSKSSDSCNIAVTCRAQGSHISSTFRCDATNCSQEGGERSEVTASGAFLHIYLANGSIICNHSNEVSRTEDMKNTQDFCPQHDGSEHVSAGVSLCLVKTVVFSVGLIIMVTAVISVHIMENLKKKN